MKAQRLYQSHLQSTVDIEDNYLSSQNSRKAKQVSKTVLIVYYH